MQTVRYLSLVLLLSGFVGAYAAPAKGAKAEQEKKEVKHVPTKGPKKKKVKHPSKHTAESKTETKPVEEPAKPVKEEKKDEPVVEVKVETPAEKVKPVENAAPAVETPASQEGQASEPDAEAQEHEGDIIPGFTEEENAAFNDFVDGLGHTIDDLVTKAVCDNEVAIKYAQLHPDKEIQGVAGSAILCAADQPQE